LTITSLFEELSEGVMCDGTLSILSRGSIACMPRSFVEFMQSNPPPAFLDGGNDLLRLVLLRCVFVSSNLFYREESMMMC